MSTRTKGTARRASIIFLPLALVAAGVMLLLYRAQVSAISTVIRSEQVQLVTLGQQRIIGNLGLVVPDIAYLSRQENLRQWFSGGDPAARAALAADYLAFAASKNLYDNIRLLDTTGREIVRVNWNDGQPFLVPEDRLQKKSDRYYVHEALKLGAGQVYASRFDLSVEYGMVEQPPRPTIRFAAPVFDPTGHKRGLIVLNYLGPRLLQRIASLAEAGGARLWLVNASGHWLLGPRPEDSWGFMYPDGDARAMAASHPDAWQRIAASGPSGQFDLQGDLYTYMTVSPAEARVATTTAAEWDYELVSPESFTLIAHLPASAIGARTAPVTRSFSIAAAVLLLLIAGASWQVGRHWAERRAVEDAVRASESRFRGLLESAPDAVVITGIDGQIVYANARTEQLFGYSRNELIGRDVELLIPERYRARHVEHRRSYAALPRAREMGEKLELYGRHKNGTEVAVAISLSPIKTANGLQIFADIRDITERRQAELQLKRLNDRLTRDNAELELLNKELEAFSYSVSHDLRAPLRAIDGFSQALLEDCAEQLDAEGKDYLNRVRGAAQRMGLLIDDLLKLARVTRSELSLEDVDLSAMAQEMADNLQRSAPERDVQFGIASGLQVRGDPRLMGVALENLLNNAWKFTRGRSPARIELGRSEGEGEGALFVRDNGVGFDMKYAGKLFGAFQRLHDASEFPGTGIGLATVQRIIRKHGGRIWAEAEPGRGATFHFTLWS